MSFDPDKPPPAAAIEQYKAKLTDLGNLGTRLTGMTTYYVSLISAFLGVLAFKDRKLSDIEPFVVIVVCGGGFLVALLWHFNIKFFRSVFRAKLQMLEQMEETFPFQTFKTEFSSNSANGRKSWLNIEQRMPLIFCAVFATILFARFCPLAR